MSWTPDPFEKPEITFCLFPELACEEGVNPVFVQTAVNPASYGLQLKQCSDFVLPNCLELFDLYSCIMDQVHPTVDKMTILHVLNIMGSTSQ